MWYRALRLSVCAALLVGVAVAQEISQPEQTQQQPSQSSEQQEALPLTHYPVHMSTHGEAVDPSLGLGSMTIGGGDLLQVSVFGVPDMSQDVRVTNSGQIMLPLIGRVQVAGLTPEKLQALLERRYSEGGYLNNPQVSVFVKEWATQGISVLGEVEKPGIYPLLGSRRLFDALSAAGGVTDKAGNTVSITHREETAPVVVTLPNDPTRLGEANVPVYPGDTVVISRAGVVYVVGEVGKPGGFIMANNKRVTVLQALALAEGTKRDAALNRARLVRRTPSGLQEIELPLKDILAAKQPDVELQADDVIFVPGSLGKTALRRSAEAIIQVATGVAIWGTVR